ncbi:MAG: YDG domain-containing protein [Sphingomonas phyllosphaerae]
MYDHGGMNRFFRLVWNDARQCYVPIPEVSNKRGKRKGGLSAGAAAAALAMLLAQGAAADPGQLTTIVAPGELPTGGHVVAGQATITQAGQTQTIDQMSQQAAIDWQSFNIGKDGKVVFNQPNASAIALNRVLGNDGSKIYGVLQANGQVFLVNPNGVLFAKGSQVSAAAIMASTRDLSVADFVAGKYRLSGSSAAGVVNEGSLTAAPGGYIALVGATVVNAGSLSAALGDVRLAAADDVTISLDHGGLSALSIDRGSYDALVANNGIIKADGGRIFLTADALDALAKASVSNAGIIEAQTVGQKNGRIVLLGDMKVGSTTVTGTLDASAPNGGDGGFIETSAAHVALADSARVTTAAPGGRTGTFLIDPTDFVIAASGGDMTGADLGNAMAVNNVVIQSTSGAGGTAGKIVVNDAVSWSAHLLTLSAQGDIELNVNLNASGSAKLALEYGQSTTNGTGFGYKFGTGARINLPAGQNFSTKQGSGGPTVDYTVITSLGSFGDTNGTTLQGIDGGLSGSYVLGDDIDASGTTTWDSNSNNSSQGFRPIGGASTTDFTGALDGLGHKITNLYVNRASDNIGLFATTRGASIRNLSVNGSFFGQNSIGGLSGADTDSTFANVALFGGSSISGASIIGGLVGSGLRTTIVNAKVDGESLAASGGTVGGVIGSLNGGKVDTATVSMPVTGGDAQVGGIVGVNSGGAITHVSTNITVTSTGGGVVGGIVGNNGLLATVTDAEFGGTVSASAVSKVGGIAGNSRGTLTNVRSTATVNGADYVGGIVGHNFGSIADASGGGSVTGRTYVGGVAGAFPYTPTPTSTVTGTTTATATVTGTTNVGGFVGYISGPASWAPGSISYASLSATGNVTGETNVGGLVGNLGDGAILTASSATGEVKAKTSAVGGLIGYVGSNATVDTSVASGAVTGQGAGNVAFGGRAGGLIGQAGNTVSVTNSGATGAVTGKDYTGGLIGEAGNNLTATTVTATGAVSGLKHSGGLIGKVGDGAAVTAATADGAVTGTNYAGGLIGTVGANATVTRSVGRGRITGSDYLGGLIGTAGDGLVVTTGTARGQVGGGSYVGGLIGATGTGATVTDSRAYGSVGGSNYFGGLIGRFGDDGVVRTSSADGNVAGDDYAGGLIGWAGTRVTVTNSSAIGNVDGSSYAGGLIGQIQTNATITDVTASGRVSGSDYTGGLVGEVKGGTITNGSKTGGSVSGGKWVGGLVGLNAGTVSQGSSQVGVSGTERVGGAVGEGSATSTLTNLTIGGTIGATCCYLGGVAGYNAGAISDVVFDGTVDGTVNPANAVYQVGGIVGMNDTGTITNAEAKGSVTSLGIYVGGLVGNSRNAAASITDSHSSATVNGQATVGGLVGLNEGKIKNSYATGQVTGTRDTVGGLIGYTDTNSVLETVYATGNVAGAMYVGGLIGYAGTGALGLDQLSATGNVTGRSSVGGLIGYVEAGDTITASHATGTVTGTKNVGGLIGYADERVTVTGSYARGAVTGAKWVGGLIGQIVKGGTVSDVTASGDVTATIEVGGLIGIATGTAIDRATASGAVSGGASAGGLIGHLAYDASGSIANSSATGVVGGTTAVGGLAGQTDDATTITASFATGNVTGGAQSVGVGGLVGANGAAITNSYSTGNVTGDVATSINVGGVAGSNSAAGILDNVHADGTVSNATRIIGGLVGQNLGVLKNSRKTVGAVSGGMHAVGGLVGLNNGEVSASTSQIDVTGEDYVGGAVGQALQDSTVSALTVGGTITLNKVNSPDSFSLGGVVGRNHGKLTNVVFDGTVVSAVNGVEEVGGVVGNNEGGFISNAEAKGIVTATHGLNVGGLVGRNDSSIQPSMITGSHSSATVTADHVVGGLVGLNSGRIVNSFATGAVEALDYTAGGLIGLSDMGSSLGQVYATGTVKGYGSIGGLIGQVNSGTLAISGVYATGDVNGTDYTGGLIGFLQSDITIGTSYATGAVTGTAYTGGLIGYADANTTVSGSSARGTVTGTDYTGGLIGFADANSTIRDSSAQGIVTGGDHVGGLIGDIVDSSISNVTASANVTGIIDVGGLIGWAEGVTIDQATASGAVDGRSNVGGFVGRAIAGSAHAGSIGHSSASGAVTGTTGVGGFAGDLEIATTDSSATGAVTAQDKVGGFAGSSALAGTMTRVNATGRVTVTPGQATAVAGGLVGAADSAIDDSYATGDVSGQTVAALGGLAGTSAKALTKVYATGAVSAVTSDAVGGLVGSNSGSIDVAYASGSVDGGTASLGVGGLVGRNAGTITDAYETGAVTGTGNIGGVVGKADAGSGSTSSAIANVYAKGAIGGSGTIGGLIGSLDGGTVATSYWNADTTTRALGVGATTGGTISASAALSDAQARQQANYAGYDFSVGGKWKNYDSDTTPLLTAWLTGLTLTANDAPIGHVYDGTGKTDAVTALVYSDPNAPASGHVLGNALHYATGKNVGTYTDLTGLYSDQHGYNITIVNNGSLTITPKAITVMGKGQKTYDGLTSIGVTLSSNDIVAGDAVSFAGTGTLADKNAGLGKTVSVTGITGSGADVGNYVFASTTTSTADVAKRALTFTSAATGKVYDGLRDVAVTLTPVGLVSGDSVSLAGTGTLADKNVGVGKAVAVTGVAASGADAQNYDYATSGATTVDVARKAISVVASAPAKTYDGTTAVAVLLSSGGVVAGDTVSFDGKGTTADKNVGLARPVAVTGIAASGADARNYDYNASAATTVDVARKRIVLNTVASDREYDGTTDVRVAIGSSDIVAGDAVAFTGKGSLADKNAGLNKAVAVTGVTASGRDAGNYDYATNASGTANVSRRALSVVGEGKRKGYDGKTDIDVIITQVTGRVSGDQVVVSGRGTAADKNAGLKTVTYSFTATGADAGNYSLPVSQTGSVTIVPVGLALSLLAPISKVGDGTTLVQLSPSNFAIDGLVAGESISLATRTGQFADAAIGTRKSVTAAINVGDYVAGPGTSLANYVLWSGTLSAAVGEIVSPTNPSYDSALTSAIAAPVRTAPVSSLFSTIVGQAAPATSTGDKDNGVSTQKAEGAIDGSIAAKQSRESLLFRRTFSIADGGIKLPAGVEDDQP